MSFVVFLKRVSSYLIKDEILILIHMIQEDLEVQIHVKEVFDRIKSKGSEVLNKFFELLVDKFPHVDAEETMRYLISFA